jgi:hypothetical protein
VSVETRYVESTYPRDRGSGRALTRVRASSPVQTTRPVLMSGLTAFVSTSKVNVDWLGPRLFFGWPNRRTEGSLGSSMMNSTKRGTAENARDPMTELSGSVVFALLTWMMPRTTTPVVTDFQLSATVIANERAASDDFTVAGERRILMPLFVSALETVGLQNRVKESHTFAKASNLIIGASDVKAGKGNSRGRGRGSGGFSPRCRLSRAGGRGQSDSERPEGVGRTASVWSAAVRGPISAPSGTAR